ncbi:hypothetical protein M3583_21830, partial [Bacillus subtilis]|nr:hypothetical protein [Bacillus subtilis]
IVYRSVTTRYIPKNISKVVMPSGVTPSICSTTAGSASYLHRRSNAPARMRHRCARVPTPQHERPPCGMPLPQAHTGIETEHRARA